MKVVAVIPIKLNNERLPGKNTKKFSNGRPLCSYISKTAQLVPNIDDVYVFCSDSNICKYLPEGIRYLSRSKTLDLSNATMNDVLNEFITKVSADVYVLLHATSPFVSARSIETAVESVTSGEYDSAVAVKKERQFVWKNSKPNYNLCKIPRTQDLEPYYVETSGFYVFTSKVAAEGKRIGDSPRFINVTYKEAVDIDYPEDFELADVILKMGSN